ncbi:MAG: T9SS type A sorting domain-containing protein [candidate division WOR-3 bacterium]
MRCHSTLCAAAVLAIAASKALAVQWPLRKCVTEDDLQSGNRRTLSDPDDEDDAWTPSIAVYGASGEDYNVITNYFDVDTDGQEDEQFSIFQRRSRDRGINWLSPIRLTSGSDERDCAWPSLAVSSIPGGGEREFREHHLYCEDDDNSPPVAQVTYMRINRDMDEDNPDAEFITRVLTKGPPNRCNPCVASHAQGTYVYTVWSDDSVGTAHEVWLRRSTDQGTTWLPKVNLSNTPNYQSKAPCIAVAGSAVLVAWQEEHPIEHRFRIQFRRSDDYGESWSDPVCLTADLPGGLLHNRPPECFTPSLATYDNQYACLVFQAGWDSPTPGYGVMFMMSPNLGNQYRLPACGIGGWTDEEPDLDDGDAGLFPTISVAKGSSPQHPEYLNVVYSGKPSPAGDYQVYYLRGTEITSTTPPDGGQSIDRLGLPSGISLRVWPNPVESDIRAEAELVQPGKVELALYDAQGRQMREMVADKLGAGRHGFRFDLTGRAGQLLSAGTYMLVLRTADGTETRRLQVVRR